MKTRIIPTADGSNTLYIPELDETYHSNHGALQEAVHVFIENGLKNKFDQEKISIFEMGFGTGLNAILSLKTSAEFNKHVEYSGIEAFPVDSQQIIELGYSSFLSDELTEELEKMHQADWNKEIELNSNFVFRKLHQSIVDYVPEIEKYDLIYFDAFGPRAQNEMWDLSILQKMYDILKKGGHFVTYCAKGQVKRDLKSLGFEVKSLPGPPGKREMTVGIKK